MAPATIRRRAIAIAYVSLAAWCVFGVARSYDPTTGFTSLIWFGDHYAPNRLAILDSVPVHTYRASFGFDGQFYAQMAVSGNPLAPELSKALDLPSYRARRVLLPLLAHVVGLGRPGWVLTAYALANLISWLMLAWLLARWWFPPESWQDLLRWAGSLLGAGMLCSLFRSLTDGPALLMIVVGMRCLEVNRRWLGAAALGAAGLVREASILAVGAVDWPTRTAARPWARALLTAGVCVVPALAWCAIVAGHFRTVDTTSLGPPFVGLFAGLRHIAATWRAGGVIAARHDVFVVVALLVQAGFLLVHARPAQPWWRVGAAFALLTFVTDGGPWADPFLTIPRAILPLTVAFNILVPRTRLGLVVLAAGNLTLLSAPAAMEVARIERESLTAITCDYVSGFHGAETLGSRKWRWASGSASLRLRNSGSAAVDATLELDMASATDRTVILRADELQQVVPLQANRSVHVRFGPIALPLGHTDLTLTTTEPAWREPGYGGRTLTFSVQNLQVALNTKTGGR